MLWAFDQEILSSSQKFVLVALCNFSSDSGMAYPAVKTISRITNQKEETIRLALAKLVADGIIQDTGKRAGVTKQVKVFQLPNLACERLPETDTLKTTGNGYLSDVKTPHKTPPKVPVSGEPAYIGTKEQVTSSGTAAPNGSQRLSFTNGWNERWQKRFGSKYEFQGGVDGKATTRLMNMEEDKLKLLEMAEAAWDAPENDKFWACNKMSQTIAKFASKVNEIRVELERQKNPKRSGPNI